MSEGLSIAAMVDAVERIRARKPNPFKIIESRYFPVRMPDGRNCHWQFIEGSGELYVSPLLSRLLTGALRFEDAFIVCELVDP